jgi:hypothetical protein
MNEKDLVILQSFDAVVKQSKLTRDEHLSLNGMIQNLKQRLEKLAEYEMDEMVAQKAAAKLLEDAKPAQAPEEKPAS